MDSDYHLCTRPSHTASLICPVRLVEHKITFEDIDDQYTVLNYYLINFSFTLNTPSSISNPFPTLSDSWLVYLI